MGIALSSSQRKRVLYFCDETSHKGDEFMAVGGIAVNLANASEIEATISSIRGELNRHTEIKWSNAKARRDNVHQAFADLLHSLVQSGDLHFHIRFQRLQDWNHSRSGERKKIDTVSKAFYNLLLHRPTRLYGAGADIHVRPDAGECTERLHEYRPALNREARNRFGNDSSPVRSIHVRDSKKSDLLQLLDVTLGALAAVRNKRHLRDETSDVKRRLAEYIHNLWSQRDLSVNTPIDERRFNIWNARPSD